MSAVSAMMEGMDNLLFELDRTVQRWKCGRPHIDRPQRPGLGGREETPGVRKATRRARSALFLYCRDLSPFGQFGEVHSSLALHICAGGFLRLR